MSEPKLKPWVAFRTNAYLHVEANVADQAKDVVEDVLLKSGLQFDRISGRKLGRRRGPADDSLDDALAVPLFRWPDRNARLSESGAMGVDPLASAGDRLEGFALELSALLDEVAIGEGEVLFDVGPKGPSLSIDVDRAVMRILNRAG